MSSFSFSNFFRRLTGQRNDLPENTKTESRHPATALPSEKGPSPEDEETLRTAAQACLAIRHVFPPRHPRSSLSFLGGEPMAPEDFEWPMAMNREGLLEWLPFVGQIDCSRIPKSEYPCPLPKTGVLYFFLPMASGLTRENEKLAVHYVPENPGPKWMEHKGLALPPLHGETEAKYKFPWMNWLPNPSKSYPRIYPRIEIELGWVDYGDNDLPKRTEEEEEQDGEQGLPWELAAARHRANLVAFHGEPVEHNGLLYPSGKPRQELWRVHELFPWSWKAIEIAGGHLKVLLQEQREALGEKQEAGETSSLPDSPEILLALYKQVDSDADKVMSGVFKGNQEPSPEEKARFWQLLESLFIPHPLPLLSKRFRSRYDPGIIPVIHQWLSQAAILSAEACLNDPDAAPRIPAEIINALRERHAVLKSHMFKDRGWHHQHQLLGRGRNIQEAADSMSPTHLLLLQLGPDDAIDWQMGDNGAYQFWVTPADLAARRFDQTRVTFECH